MNSITNRLHIRPIRMDDKDAVFSYRSDPEINKYLSLIPTSVDDIKTFISNSSTTFNVPGTWFQLVIIEKNTHQLIGDIGIHFLTSDPHNKQVEIGYTLNKAYWGKGYASEALSAVIDYLFNTLNKHRITASIDPTNLKSIQLLERLGFRKEAHFVKSLFFHDKWVDDVIYAMLNNEWKTINKTSFNKG